MNGHANGESQNSLTQLRRWSCGDNTQLPSKDSIHAIHVYDFDNTLFSSPLPNKQLWAGPSIGQLQTQEAFVGGGWWHDSSILASTGKGLDEEETRGWAGHWNESIAELVQLSMEQRDALTVLLTGRSDSQFAALIKRIVSSKKLEFDLLVLKPSTGPNGERFSSTMAFKQAFLSTLMHTYSQATSLRIYEDRIKHTKGFRDFFEDFNSGLLSTPHYSNPENPQRGPITADVIQVSEETANLDPTTELAAVQRMINIHNAAIKDRAAPPHCRPMKLHRTVFFTGYLLSQEHSKQLRKLIKFPSSMPAVAREDVNMLANSILIAPKPADKHMLVRVGGIGHTVQWKVTGTACFENRIWAARVAPVNHAEKVFTHTRPAHVVLALRRGSRPHEADRIQNWQPLPDNITFPATVGEKVQMRIDEDFQPNVPSRTANRPGDRSPPTKRQNMREADFIPLGHGASYNDEFPRLGGGFDGANDENRRPQPQAISANQSRSTSGQYGRGGGGRNGQRPQQQRQPGGGQGGGFERRDAGGGRGRGGRGGQGGVQGGYRSLDDISGGRQVKGYADFDGAGGYPGGERVMDY